MSVFPWFIRPHDSARRPGQGWSRRGRGVALALALVAAALHPGSGARAAETQWWITDRAEDYAEGEARGVIVRPNGELELGPRTAETPAESLATIWSIAVLADGSVALAGADGRIDRWSESGGLRRWARLPVGQVLSLAADGDGVMAGTGPEGLVYRIGPRGDTTLVARTGERYVWGLAPGGKSIWYAATGTRGRLIRLEGSRQRVILDSEESNLVSLTSDGRGGVFTGGDSKGRVIHVRADGTVRTVFDAPEDEIRALARGADGAVYAAALSASAVSVSARAGAGGGGSDSAERGEGDEPEPTPAPAGPPVSGAKAIVYRIVPDSSTAEYWSSPQPFVFALAASPAGVLAGTGSRAGVFLLERPRTATQWLAPSQGQITALAVGPGGRVFAAGSNPAALWRLGPQRADRGELLSPPLDARRIARFGRIRWRGDDGGSHIQIETRSGNTDTPDTTWSEWQPGSGGPGEARITSPPARYLQWKLALSGGKPRIESVEAAWREQNVAPQIDDLSVAGQGRGFREGDLTPRSEPVTQTLPGGRKVEYSVNPTVAPTALQGLPAWAQGLRTAQWKASDANGDPLSYRADLRVEGGGPWIQLAEDLTATVLTWDTNALPDGRYRLRVIASDRGGNPIGEERTAEAVSEPFTVDNTPPTVTSLVARGERGAIVVEARAADATSPLAGFEVSLDDDDWRSVSPAGGLADDRELSFNVRLEAVKPGSHTVGVRAADLAGNTATRAVVVTVPAPR